jgi:hypothetical protein
MFDSDNRARNGDRLKFIEVVSQKRRLGFVGVEVAAESAAAFVFSVQSFPITSILYFFSIFIFN